MDDLNYKLEAILFSVGKKIHIEKLSNLLKVSNHNILISALQQLQEKYDHSGSPMMIVADGDNWKLTVRERYLPLVRNLVVDTEMSRPITETLAVIAFKYPVSQSEIVKIRSNKSYEHIRELQDLQFVEKIKNGRTFDLKLTQKFFNYFDLPEKDVKDKFKNFEEVEKIIEAKEKDLVEKQRLAKEANILLKEKLKSEKETSDGDKVDEVNKFDKTNDCSKNELPILDESFSDDLGSNPKASTVNSDNVLE
jgi:segregation and condensation protein B